MGIPGKRLLSHRETCAYLGVSYGTLEKMVQEGTMPRPIRFGAAKNASKRYDLVDVDKAIQKLSEHDTSNAEAQRIMKGRRS